MEATRALLWKEMRQVGPWAAVLLGLLLLMLVVRLETSLNALFSRPIQDILPWLCWGYALGAGLGTLAGERQQGTLAFLMGRPLKVGHLLLVQIGVRLSVLLVLVLTAAAVLYAAPLDGLMSSPSQQAFIYRDNRILDHVEYAALAYLWFMQACTLFGYGLAASAIAGDTSRAAVIAVLTVWSVETVPLVLHKVSGIAAFYHDYLRVKFDDEGSLVQLARSPGLLFWYGLAAGTPALLSWGVAWWGARRLTERGSGLSWPVVAGLCAVAAMPLLFLLTKSVGYGPRGKVYSAAAISYEKWARDLALHGDHIFVLTDSTLSAVDATDWRQPRKVGRVAAPGWNFHQVALAGSEAYAWGHWNEGDSAYVGFARFNIERADAPQLVGRVLLQPLQSRERYMEKSNRVLQQEVPLLIDWAAHGRRLYAGVVDERQVEIVCWGLEGTEPRLLWRHPIAAVEGWGPQPDFGLRLRGDQAFFARHGVLSVWDLSPLEGPEELSRTVVQEAPWVASKSDKLLMLDGDRVYLRRSWPEEVAVLDIANVRTPVEVRPVLWAYGYNRDAQTDGAYIYDKDWSELDIYRIAAGGATLKLGEWGLTDEQEMGETSYAQVILTDEFICTLLSNNLAFFPSLGGD
ncbi:MAG: hypothetical protein GKR89_17450 [Candidatus Latescibacteria bacterium]|nr:hypothetical protein [Candidatus Latescibacterota bacterium]